MSTHWVLTDMPEVITIDIILGNHTFTKLGTISGAGGTWYFAIGGHWRGDTLSVNIRCGPKLTTLPIVDGTAHITLDMLQANTGVWLQVEGQRKKTKWLYIGHTQWVLSPILG